MSDSYCCNCIILRGALCNFLQCIFLSCRTPRLWISPCLSFIKKIVRTHNLQGTCRKLMFCRFKTWSDPSHHQIIWAEQWYQPRSQTRYLFQSEIIWIQSVLNTCSLNMNVSGALSTSVYKPVKMLHSAPLIRTFNLICFKSWGRRGCSWCMFRLYVLKDSQKMAVLFH